MTPADKEPWRSETPAVKAAGGWPPADGAPYMPANGTEGEIFYCGWCQHCTRDQAFRDNPDYERGCAILADSYLGTQPKEWLWKDGRPICLAFTDKPLPEPRCPYTLEMFE